MKKTIYLNGNKIEYTLEYKRVKNINLRIKPDGEVYVSASKRVPFGVIEDFILSKSDFILNAIEKYKNIEEKPRIRYFTEQELKAEIIRLCNMAYPYYEKYGIDYPVIKFRKMTSRWGSCHPKKGVLNFNTALMYAPAICVEYVVWHEFTHFLQANHSALFYAELEKVFPEWKKCRIILRDIPTEKNTV